ncbi:hypothetical protein [Fibrobacter intestinalis]|uniref:hypothetical protein n=2 Tax=Fibrobacter intestinalis TaxID=28122 RepID=UPI0023F2B7D2|nr:hypothetical protein [Fibrobacter intestinalis]MDD7299231.1 hypothetical protein [Fibrobacter intestinalis]
MSLKSFTLLDELSLEGSLRKSVQGECCAASLLAGITEPQPRTQRVNSEAPLSLPPAAVLHNSPKGSGASKAHGKASASRLARKFTL